MALTNIRGGRSGGESRGQLVKQLLQSPNNESSDDWLSTIRASKCASFNLFIWKQGMGAFVYSSDKDSLTGIDLTDPFTLSNATPGCEPAWPRQERILQLYRRQQCFDKIM